MPDFYWNKKKEKFKHFQHENHYSGTTSHIHLQWFQKYDKDLSLGTTSGSEYYRPVTKSVEGTEDD